MRWVTLLLAWMMVGSATAAEQAHHLFILSGQSNMLALDPANAFTPTLQAALGRDRIIVVKAAWDGQPIRRWVHQWRSADGATPEITGDLYDRLMSRVRTAINGKVIATVTLVWMQGEKDARDKLGAVYADSLEGLIHQLGADLEHPDLTFVIGRLSDFDMENARFPHWTMVREAQVAVAEADPRGAWVDTDHLNDGINHKGEMIRNDLHYSVEGYEYLGRRFAEKALELIRLQTRGGLPLEAPRPPG
ncbi:MAG: sialate O-acetylesterase [Desulfosarcinaceae bacterium]|nr:sialate O-acetylesterase [Desulfosarcinaceae bacterium]